ncbi:serine--tRNA ligase [Fimbriimonas ginsengisoli]|uniref:Serine--tRNA ligase n=1 Tax=Fimbriimonas ginsengisoli Gsoil 348 TaxID=661478 RepID=A0A068NR23_FIMGI|nr:serine--tRNA ligase [Fimbriimonas ginsengisoli]AIE85200.1 seryl-tRNA synthetase [Fimbriimonas ginsengisoli Gsoil 348]
MLDRDLIRRHPDAVRLGISRKGIDASIVDRFLEIDAEYRRVKTETGELQAESNRVSKSIGQLMAQGKRDDAEAAKARAKELKDAATVGETREKELETAMREVELEFPNLPHESVPNGRDETENVVVRMWGERPTYAEAPQPHWDVADRLGLVDLARGAKITGSGFVVYTGWGARLQRALFTFMLDVQTQKNGYREIYPPYVVNRASLIGTGNLPKFEEDLYRTTDDLFLIPTAEVPLTNLYRDEILDNDQLTVKLAGYSSCFRREAGAAGKDTRGIQRIHQFDKVELVKFCRPEESYDELETLVADAESVLQALGIHYRIVELCAGDLGAKGCKCYDLELWSPAMDKYLEISSCTNFEAYQARRANIKFRRAQGEKPEFVHILNGSGLALPRLFASILETFQQPDGSLLVPEALRPYVGTEFIR